MLKKKKILIVDGYNVLRSGERYKHLCGDAPNFLDWTLDTLNSAREALLNDVLLMTDNNTQAIIVYDAANFKGKKTDLKTNKIKNLDVIFTDFGESADDRIQFLARNYREKSLDVVVVTSDLQIQDTTINKGVVRMSSKEFSITASNNSKDVESFKKDITSSLDKENFQSKDKTYSSKIENIVDTKTAEKLKSLRDSL